MTPRAGRVIPAHFPKTKIMKQKLKGTMRVHRFDDYVEFEIMEKNSRLHFIEIKMKPEEFYKAFMQHLSGEIDIELLDEENLSKVGKNHENQTFEFPIGKETEFSHSKGLDRKKTAIDIAPRALQAAGMVGWEPDQYYGSQDSFKTRNGVLYARCTIRRWT